MRDSEVRVHRLLGRTDATSSRPEDRRGGVPPDPRTSSGERTRHRNSVESPSRRGGGLKPGTVPGCRFCPFFRRVCVDTLTSPPPPGTTTGVGSVSVHGSLTS